MAEGACLESGRGSISFVPDALDGPLVLVILGIGLLAAASGGEEPDAENDERERARPTHPERTNRAPARFLSVRPRP